MAIKSLVVSFGLGAAAVAGLVIAGPLNPPAGPVASTYKTLSDVEPRIAINAANTPGDATSLFKITQPGSYYLTGNITGVAGKHGIAIAASGVTLDLNGFDLVGAPGSLDGVSSTAISLTNIGVANGSARNWGGEGVDLVTSGPASCRIEGVRASFNAGAGIAAGGAATVSQCSSYQNSGNGISASLGGTVGDCSAYSNVGAGITVAGACSVTRCSASLNNSGGIACGVNSTITDCSAYNNTSHGINTSSACTITGCTAGANNGPGIRTGSGCTIGACSAYGNTGHGISVLAGSAISDCSAEQNNGSGVVATDSAAITACSSYQNVIHGVSAGFGCTVTGCSVYNNSGSGIVAADALTVVECTAAYNNLDGILFGSRSVARGNTCSNNGFVTGNGAGIHAAGTRSRIEGNNCTDAPRGIDVDGSGSIIIRNTCAGNASNWEIAPGNSLGPIVVVATNAAAIAGNGAAPSTLGSTDPNANFSY